MKKVQLRQKTRKERERESRVDWLTVAWDTLVACVMLAAAAAASSTLTGALAELPLIKYAPPPPLTTASWGRKENDPHGRVHIRIYATELLLLQSNADHTFNVLRRAHLLVKPKPLSVTRIIVIPLFIKLLIYI